MKPAEHGGFVQGRPPHVVRRVHVCAQLPCRMNFIPGFGYHVSDFGYRVPAAVSGSGFGYRVSGTGFRVQDFGFRVLSSPCGPPRSGPRSAAVSSFGYQFSGFGYHVSDFECGSTSLITPPPLLGPYSRTIPRVIWWS